MNQSKNIENIFIKIFSRIKTHELGLFEHAAKMAVHDELKRITFLKEIKEQIRDCRSSIIEVFGLEIIKDIENIKLR